MIVLFGGVIYPEGIHFFDEFISSINEQSYEEFSLLLINDGIDDTVINSSIKPKIDRNYTIIDNERGLNPNDLRVMLMLEAKDRGADLLIIGDSDDKFSIDRVSSVVKEYEKRTDFSFFYNDLRFFDGTRAMPDMPRMTLESDELVNYNYLGLSNTTLVLRDIDCGFLNSLFGSKDYAFDWYLYARLLEDGKRGHYIPATTYYRIYDGNMVGNLTRTEADIQKEIDVKVKHYQEMAKNSEKYVTFVRKYKEGDFEENISRDGYYYWWNYLRMKGDLR